MLVHRRHDGWDPQDELHRVAQSLVDYVESSAGRDGPPAPEQGDLSIDGHGVVCMSAALGGQAELFL